MPEHPPRLVGRTDDLHHLLQHLAATRVVALVGPPGVGKSYLARVALAEVADDWLELAPADLSQDDRALDGQSHILLDGFEELADRAESVLGPLIDEAPDTTWLVTSRRRLPFPRAQTVLLRPLLPEDALTLFAERARDVAPDFDVEARRDDVELLLQRLDHNPLAIELAAARLRTFSPADLLERLDRRFALLRPGRGEDRPSLEESIERSWALLDDAERDVLRQCAIFRGGFDLDAAEAVVRLDDAPWALDVVESLVDRSLLVRADDAGSSARGRLGMYESIRDFAAARTDDASEVVQRHADYFLRLGDEWRRTSWTAVELDEAAADVDNVIAVVDRFGDRDTTTTSAVLALDAVLRYRGASAPHRRLLDRGVDAAASAESDPALSELLLARAELSTVTGQLDEAGTDAAQASALARQAGNWPNLVRSEVVAAEAERRTGSARDALTRLESLADALEQCDRQMRRYVLAHRAACHAELGELSEARDIAMHVPPPDTDCDVAIEYAALKRLAYAHYYLGNYEHQHRLNHDALQLAERVGDRRRIARARQGIGDAAFARGDYAEVRDHYAAALQVHRELGNEHLEGVLLGNLGSAEHRIDELDDAARHYAESLAIHQRSGATPYEAVVTFALAVLEHERDHFDDAAFRYDRAAELFGELKQPDDVAATLVCRSWLELLRQDVDAANLHLDWAEVSAPASWAVVVDGTRRLIVHRTDDETDVTLDAATDDTLPSLLSRGLRQLVCSDDIAPEDRDALRATLQGRLLLKFAPADSTPKPEQRPASPSPDLEILVGEGGEWFQLPPADPVNLRRRRAHRLLLDRLMALYESDPGTPIDVYDAFEIGWPGESATPDVAAERVYWAVGSLRKLGLDDVLLTSDAGYYLDPGARIARTEDPTHP